jgi:DAK2 domain fusion protein YloV
MSNTYSLNQLIGAIAHASSTLSSRKEEINRLNVFPVPDGDTGTNMSLTLESVVNNLGALHGGFTKAEVRKAIVSGALMGARGNSGVITSQILRGLCEGAVDADSVSTESISAAFDKAVEVAFQAVRKPVEGTILTVLRDSASAASIALQEGLSTDDAMQAIVKEAYASVQRTPDYLAVLKENGVVDAGGFGLAILMDGFASSLMGRTEDVGAAFEASVLLGSKVEIEQINDWEGSDYRYCNEFLVDSDTLDTQEALDFLQTMGDCELCVGSNPKFKVHVHSNEPDKVLKYFLERGQISEVHIHNMDLQAAERIAKIAEESQAEEKEIGIVAVAAGSGNAEILKSLGVDAVVSGGQTMNPSTKDLLDAAASVNAKTIIFLPNNSNIIMAANSACELEQRDAACVTTRSVPEAFAAMFAFDLDASLEDNVEAMTDAISEVVTIEVTQAIKDAKAADGSPIASGDTIGISGGKILSVGQSVNSVVVDILGKLNADEYDTCTLLAGEDLTNEDAEGLESLIEENYEDLEIDLQRGEQPLYPVILSLE